MIHLVGLPHTPFNEFNASTCAFTTKSVRLARMLQSVGEPVLVYWGGSQGRAESGPWGYVPILTNKEQDGYFGKFDISQLPVPEFDPTKPYWRKFNQNAIKEIKKTIRKGDIIMIVGGTASHPVADEFAGPYIVTEPEVGYSGICGNTFACFESYAWMHHVYGMKDINDGRYFDTVIPNFHDPAAFETGPDEDYVLYLGRMIMRKGVKEAALMADMAGKKLIYAGNGVKSYEKNHIVCEDGTVIKGDNIEYVGAVNPETRKRLLSRASCLIVPTRYIEPFGTVHIEALLSGIAVVAPDYGVFTETIPREWRFRMAREGAVAIQRATASRGAYLRDEAIQRFSVDVCAKQYKDWLEQLRTLDGLGWYSL